MLDTLKYCNSECESQCETDPVCNSECLMYCIKENSSSKSHHDPFSGLFSGWKLWASIFCCFIIIMVIVSYAMSRGSSPNYGQNPYGQSSSMGPYFSMGPPPQQPGFQQPGFQQPYNPYPR
jgi:hypothetical protein